jgi:hypothetical protein
MNQKKNVICKSCGGPVKDYPNKKVVNPCFCPYCVDEAGELLGYKEIVETMIDYIKSDHPEIKKEKRIDKAEEWLRETEVWGEKWRGCIIEESLEDKEVLKLIKILKSEVSNDSNQETNHGYKTWHIHEVEFFRTELDKIIDLLKNNLRVGKWWVDLSGKEEIAIVFRGKVFKGIKGDKEFKKRVNEYGRKIELPEEQLPFRD